MNNIVPEEGVVINKAEARRLFRDYHARWFKWMLTATVEERQRDGQFVLGMIQAIVDLANEFGVPIEVIPAEEEHE